MTLAMNNIYSNLLKYLIDTYSDHTFTEYNATVGYYIIDKHWGDFVYDTVKGTIRYYYRDKWGLGHFSLIGNVPYTNLSNLNYLQDDTTHICRCEYPATNLTKMSEIYKRATHTIHMLDNLELYRKADMLRSRFNASAYSE